MRQQLEAGRPGQRGERLVVLLPGAYNSPEHFLSAGFASALRRRHGDTDLLLPDLSLDLITDGSAHRRIRDEVLAPARAAGYREIWLGGNSLGGMMALSYVEAHPGAVDGLCLLAPYPGSRILTGPIAAAGLARWQAPADQLHDPEVRMWRWLQQHAGSLPVFLGYGADDRFAGGIALMGSAFPPGQVVAIQGGHDWIVWRILWERFLDHPLFCPAEAR